MSRRSPTKVTWSTDLLRPLWRAAIAQVLVAKVMHLDATGLPVLDREAESGKRLGSLWGYVGDKDVTAYLYASTGKKHAQRPQELGPADMLARRGRHARGLAARGLQEALRSRSFDRRRRCGDLRGYPYCD